MDYREHYENRKGAGKWPRANTVVFEQGDNACARCQTYSHRNCRVRLDGTLCSCKCPAGVAHRVAYQMDCELAELRGDTVPSVTESIISKQGKRGPKKKV